MSNDDFELDLTNYKDRVGSRVTPGRYRVYVEDAEMGQTSKKDPMINIWLLIQGGEFDGATIIDRLLPAHEKALFRVVGFMDAIGLPTPKKRNSDEPTTAISQTLSSQPGSRLSRVPNSQVMVWRTPRSQLDAPVRVVTRMSSKPASSR